MQPLRRTERLAARRSWSTLSESPGYIPSGPRIGARLTIVCGPPRAGKNTYVETHSTPDDVVIDLDAFRDRGMTIDEAYACRNAALQRAVNSPFYYWLIIGAPLMAQRRELRENLDPGEIIVLETPALICHRRTGRPEINDAINRWWYQYVRDPADSVVT